MNINKETVREALHQAVSKVLGEKVPPLEDKMSMFEELRMDSTTMLETMMELEDVLHFTVDPEDLDIEDFLTVDAYIQFLLQIKQQQPS